MSQTHFCSFAMPYIIMINTWEFLRKIFLKWFHLDKTILCFNVSFSEPIKTACPDAYYKKKIYCRNSTWMHLNTSKYAVWIQLRVLYSVNNIRYTNMQRFEKKMKIKTLIMCPEILRNLRHKIQGAIYDICRGNRHLDFSATWRLHTKDEELTRFFSHIHQENYKLLVFSEKTRSYLYSASSPYAPNYILNRIYF